MNLKLGAEPKKVVILIGLLVVAGVVFFSNSTSDGPGPSAGTTSPRPAAAPPRPAPGITQTSAPKAASRPSRGQRTLQEFRPTLKRRPEDRIDPTTVDPALKVDVLARLQKVTVEGNRRSIFEFSSAPPPPVQTAKATPAKPVPNPIVETANAATDPAKPAAPVKPPAPPIPLKFYGYIAPSAQGKRAFFLEGEEIHVVSEGDLVKRRYKIVRIGINSAVVEDTQFQNQQTLPLEEQPG